jgi:hypothetical protein
MIMFVFVRVMCQRQVNKKIQLAEISTNQKHFLYYSDMKVIGCFL